MKSWIKTRSLLVMHLIVIILGFTGVLGKLIESPSIVLVWYRMLIAALAIIIFMLFLNKSFKIKIRSILNLLGIGMVVASHWLFFFESIKVSNVSVAVVCMGTSSLFSSFLEPIFLKRKIVIRELILSLVIIFALALAMSADLNYLLGYIYGVLAAFLAALFTILNAKALKHTDALKITMFEMIGGFLFLSIYIILYSNSVSLNDFSISSEDLVYLFILGVVCTSFAFVVSVEVMKYISPFSVIMAVNLEPIYSIILALILFGDTESMRWSFYLGALIIICTVFYDGYLKSKRKHKLK